MNIGEPEKITPEKAIHLLKKEGLKISKEEAILMLDFLYEMAKIAVEQTFNQYEN